MCLTRTIWCSLLLASTVAAAQTINVNQIRPSTENTDVITTVGGHTVWALPSQGTVPAIPLVFWSGLQTANNQIFAAHVVPVAVTVPTSCTNSAMQSYPTATGGSAATATGSLTFTFVDLTTSTTLCSFAVSASGTTATVSGAGGTVAAGDSVAWVGAATPDATFANFAIVVSGTVVGGGGGGGIPYPSGTGIPNVSGGAAWATTYNAGNLIPATFLPLGTSGAPGALQCGTGLTCTAGVAAVTGGGGGVPYPSGTGIPQVFGGVSWASTLSLQGTDTKVMTAGTVAGTGVNLCTDSLGGATTTGCPAPSLGGSGTLGFLPEFTATATIGNSPIDDGITNAGALTFSKQMVLNDPTHPSQMLFGYSGNVPTVGSSTQAGYAVNASGQGVLSEAGAAYSRICTAGNSVCASASPLTTKGDLFGHSTVDARVPVGTNGQVLQADSAQTLGIKYGAVALASLATQAADTVVQNATGGSATPTAVAMPTCTTGADLYNTSTHSWSCVSTGGGGNYVNITASLTPTNCTVTSGVCTTTGNVASVTLAAIPGTYRHLRIIVNGAQTDGSPQQCYIQFNGDSTSGNYKWVAADNGSINTTNGTGALVGTMTSTSQTGFAAMSKIEIADYAQTTWNKETLFESSYYNSGGHTYTGASWWTSTTAITSILYFPSTGNVGTGTSFTVYGEN